jgi:hypothetical protein
MIMREFRESRIAVSLACILFILVNLTSFAAEQSLRNQDVVKMVSANLGENLIIAKIRQAPNVEFKLEVEDLLALRKAGVNDSLIQAMLDRNSGPGWARENSKQRGVKAPADPFVDMRDDFGIDFVKVALVSGNETVPIRLMRGKGSSTGFGPYRNVFMDYPGLRARVRSRDHNPSLLVKSSAPLSGGKFYVAKLDVDEKGGVRSLKISSFRGQIKSLFGSDRGILAPDPDWIVPFESSESGQDLWRVTFKSALEPGEYGWFVDLGGGSQSAGLFDFGVD